MARTTTGRTAGAAVLAIAALLLGGCGYVGDPLPPALNIAKPVQDLRAVEYGPNIVLDFTIAPLTTEGLVVKRIGTVELHIGPGVAPWDMNQWESKAQVIRLDVQETGAVSREIPAHDFIGKNIVLGVRIVNPKGRPSEWSNLVSMTVRPPLAPPSEIKAESVEKGVRLTWNSDAPSFRIFRETGHEEPAPIGNSEKPEYVDASAHYGVTYRYLLQAVNGNSESVISPAVTITPEDRFAPPPPTGLTAAPGGGGIELVWDRGDAPDLKDYRVYRAVDGQDFQRVAEVDTPAYSDHQVESGKTYRYAVSAVDQKGNESGKSTTAQATAP